MISERVNREIEYSLNSLVPFLSAIREERKEDADRLSQLMNSAAVKFTADVWHTLFCIAFQRFSESETKELSFRRLTESPMISTCDPRFNRQKFIDAGIPFYHTMFTACDPDRSRLSTDPYPYEPAVDCAYDGKENLIPLALHIGEKKVQKEHGIASGAYGIASYQVPGNLYSELEVYAGVHPDSASDQEMTFAVWCHEAGNPLLAIGKASRKTDALHFVVPLPETARSISLLAAGGNRNTSAIWLDPVLKSRIG